MKTDNLIMKCIDSSVVCRFHKKGEPCSACKDVTAAANFIIQKIKPKNGTLNFVINADFVALLITEYADQFRKDGGEIEFVNYLEDNGWSCVWSDKYKLRRWTQEEVLVNGSPEYFDNLVKNGSDLSDLFNEFKSKK